MGEMNPHLPRPYDNSFFENLNSERNILRDELHDLKKCQINYFLITIGAVSILFGWSYSVEGYHDLHLFFYLLPLVVILPCWLTFFDKAKTITRIVAYLRVLEKLLINPNTEDYTYLGWENALAIFRTKQTDISKTKKIRRSAYYFKKGFFILSTFKRIHRYWLINWCTFFFLTNICWFKGIRLNIDGIESQVNFWNFFTTEGIVLKVLIYIALIIIGIIIAYSIFIIGSLLKGMYSYNIAYMIWETILLQDRNLARRKEAILLRNTIFPETD